MAQNSRGKLLVNMVLHGESTRNVGGSAEGPRKVKEDAVSDPSCQPKSNNGLEALEELYQGQCEETVTFRNQVLSPIEICESSEEDPFANSDSDGCYVPETSTSHYSDSEPETIVKNKKKNNNHKKENIQIQETKENEIEKQITRKRKRKPEMWKRNKNRKLRLEGKEHTSQAGNIVRAKSVKAVSCKCHYKCNTNFSMHERQEIFQDFLSLSDDRARWAFINSHVSQKQPKRRYRQNIKETNQASDGSTVKRKCTLVYTLCYRNKSVQVCKQFFLSTLDISGKKVETALKKKKETGITEADKRGHNTPTNKIPEECKNGVRNHIKSIPVVESHYCRSTTKRKYLPSGLTTNRLYIDYIKYCEENQIQPVSIYFYKHIFTTEFNYSFHKPKKDQCDYCAQYKNKPENEKLQTQGDYDLHLLRKVEAREHKQRDKDRARNDPTFRAYTMDLEKILLSPQLEIGQLYYKRKFKTYNFTIYNLGEQSAVNFMWHETNGKKGSSEVATCIYKLLSELPSHVTEVTFYSDTVTGQNRNSIVSAMFLRAVSVFENLKIVNQKFMEPGHSEMECDSVHSAIETRGRKMNIFVPDSWYTVARTAKTTQPQYIVKELDYSEFLNFKDYSQKLITNKNKINEQNNADNGVMKWLKVKWFQYKKQNPMCIYYKNQLSELTFNCLNVRHQSTRQEQNLIANEIPPLYLTPLGIDKNKLKDLQDLCKNDTIPRIYHNFYMNLSTSLSCDDNDLTQTDDDSTNNETNQTKKTLNKTQNSKKSTKKPQKKKQN